MAAWPTWKPLPGSDPARFILPASGGCGNSSRRAVAVGEMKKGANQRVGAQGEEVAVDYLTGLRYRIVERNFRCKGGEVDIVARDGKTLVFVEVKARRNLN